MSQTKVINRLVRNCAEIITEDELRQRLIGKEKLTHYIGFEVSGYMHIGQGIMSALVIKDLVDLGVKSTIWLADWHAWINEKLDGSKETASAVGQGYFTEAVRAAYLAVGGNPNDLEFRLASNWYADHPDYWEYVIRVAQHTTLSRMQRSIDIMGRSAGDSVDYAKTIYPAMQVADIFSQNIDIAHSGMDQRKAHVIMRDVADKLRPSRPKPIAFHHPLLVGLKRPPQWPLPDGTDQKEVITRMKMSKSDAASAVWIHDSPEEIQAKINKAFCPEREIHFNPVLNWVGHILFWHRTCPLRIERPHKFGGNVEFSTYQELARTYAAGKVHPADLKATVAQELIDLLKPVRDHFAKKEVAAKKQVLDNIIQNK